MVGAGYLLLTISGAGAARVLLRSIAKRVE
jgi:hypothetical protein